MNTVNSKKYISDGDSIYCIETMGRRQMEILRTNKDIRGVKTAFTILQWLHDYEQNRLGDYLKKLLLVAYDGKPDYSIRDIPQLYRIDIIRNNCWGC